MSAGAATSPRRILFVCHANTSRSIIAEAVLQRLLAERGLAGTLEEAWATLRAERGESFPRTVNLITGPSRTGDIEQRIQMGAHGPRRLHILVVEDER